MSDPKQFIIIVCTVSVVIGLILQFLPPMHTWFKTKNRGSNPSTPSTGDRLGSLVKFFTENKTGKLVGNFCGKLAFALACAILTHFCLEGWSWYQNLSNGQEQSIFWIFWASVVFISAFWKKWVAPSLFLIGMLVKVSVICFPQMSPERDREAPRVTYATPREEHHLIHTVAGAWSEPWENPWSKIGWTLEECPSYEVRINKRIVYKGVPGTPIHIPPGVSINVMEFKTSNDNTITLRPRK